MTIDGHSAAAVPSPPSYASFLARSRHLHLPVLRLLAAVTGDENEASALALEVLVRAARKGREDDAGSTTAVFREALTLVRSPGSRRGHARTGPRDAYRPEFDLSGGEVPEVFDDRAGTVPAESAEELLRLPPVRRNIVLLYFAAGLPADQTARVVGVSVRRVEEEVRQPPPVARKLSHARATVRAPWYFEALLMQRLAQPGRRSTRPRRVPALVILLSVLSIVLAVSVILWHVGILDQIGQPPTVNQTVGGPDSLEAVQALQAGSSGVHGSPTGRQRDAGGKPQGAESAPQPAPGGAPGPSADVRVDTAVARITGGGETTVASLPAVRIEAGPESPDTGSSPRAFTQMDSTVVRPAVVDSQPSRRAAVRLQDSVRGGSTSPDSARRFAAPPDSVGATGPQP